MTLANAILLIAASMMVTYTVSIDTNTTDSWACGIFFAAQNGRPPRAKIFVLPQRFPVNCSEPLVDVYNSTCFDVMKKALPFWDFTADSRIRENSTIGQDLCTPIKKNVKKPGIELGFYFAYCNNDWTDTGLRKAEHLCCQDKDSVPC